MSTIERTKTSRQIAAALGKQRDFIDRRASAGAISFTTANRGRRYNLEEVKRELADREKSGKQSLSTFGGMHDLDTKTVERILKERDQITKQRNAEASKRGRFYPSTSRESYSAYLTAIGTAMHRD